MKLRGVIFVVAVVTSLFFSFQDANSRVWYSGTQQTALYGVEIIVNGSPRPSYHFNSNVYAEGVFGERYVIRVHNQSSRRVEAVISIDGRDAIDGRPADLDKRGYIIPAYSFIDVDGFRLNMSEVAAFRFTTVPDSYASRMGTPWEVGVVGVAIFPEHVDAPPPHPPYLMDEQKAASEAPRGYGSMPAPSRTQDLGTQFGERRTSLVTETSFTRDRWNSPEARLSLRYNNRRGLCQMGLSGFCYPPYPPPPWPPPPPPPPPYEQNRFSDPPEGWDHFSPWY
jgi:hypothetical protein